MAISLASLARSPEVNTNLDAMEGLVSYKTLNHKILYCNSEFLRYTGFRRVKDIEGLDDTQLVWSDFSRFYLKQERDAFNGKTYTALQPGRDKEGHCFLFFNQKLPWKNEQGDLIGLVCQAIEIMDVDFARHFNQLAHLDGFEGLYRLAAESEINISPRENDCLFFLLRGKTAKEIARFLNISHRTVEAHISHLKTKFQCKNKSELIAKALNKGYGATMSFSTSTSKPLVFNRLGDVDDVDE